MLLAAAPSLANTPDPSLTPGQVASTSLLEVCASDGRPGSAYSRAHRHTSVEDRRADFARYGINWEQHHSYEDDHLVPLCLGGADTPANRWPEPISGARGSYAKDRLEIYACRAVCSGQLDLRTAQSWFLAPADWRTAYRRVFGRR